VRDPLALVGTASGLAAESLTLVEASLVEAVDERYDQGALQIFYELDRARARHTPPRRRRVSVWSRHSSLISSHGATW